MKKYRTLKEFWPFYVREHLNPISRRLHFIGSALNLLLLAMGVITSDWRWWVAMPVVAYGFAWTGHFVFEKNRPATFKHPVLSLIADYKMFFLILTGKMDQELNRILDQTENRE